MSSKQSSKPTLVIKQATVDDIIYALKMGWSDFKQRPLMGAFFGLVYTLGGLAIFMNLFQKGQGWMIIPVAIGFPLIAPFVAAGLYDMSRRIQKGESFTFRDVATVIFQQGRRELGWMAFAVLFVFWIWMYQVRLLLALFLTRLSFSSVDGLVEAVFFTSDGWIFLAVGTGVGALLSALLFSATVISMPMLLDRQIDFITAMITSFKAVVKSPFVMLGWGAIVAVTVIFSILPAFLGLLISLPVLGHTTWHLYRRLLVFQ